MNELEARVLTLTKKAVALKDSLYAERYAKALASRRPKRRIARLIAKAVALGVKKREFSHNVTLSRKLCYITTPII